MVKFYSAKDVAEAIMSLGDTRQAKILQRFFKTAPGQYGEGDKFLGVRNPQVRMVVKEVWHDTPLEEIVLLAKSPWHEVRLCGLLIMVAKYEALSKRGNRDECAAKQLFDTYLSLHPYINNWDLVDLSAIKLAGAYELTHPETEILEEWIKPDHSLWQRRISMVSTWISIRHNEYDKALRRAEMLIGSKHDLLHKAAGWMLREIWKRGGRDELEDFLEWNVKGMPSIMLSYACEQMSQEQREYWRRMRTSF